jgi:hypothetical protein
MVFVFFEGRLDECLRTGPAALRTGTPALPLKAHALHMPTKRIMSLEVRWQA